MCDLGRAGGLRRPFQLRERYYRVRIFGIVSPLAALLLYALVYATLTAESANREKDWFFRLSLSILAMTVPFLVTLTGFQARPSERIAIATPAFADKESACWRRSFMARANCGLPGADPFRKRPECQKRARPHRVTPDFGTASSG